MNKLFAKPEDATRLNQDKMEGLLFQHIQTRVQLNELEQVNIHQGLQWLKKNNANLFAEPFICQLHKKLFGQVWM